MLSPVNLKCILLLQPIQQLFLVPMPSSADRLSQTINLRGEKSPKSTCANTLPNADQFFLRVLFHPLSKYKYRHPLPSSFLKPP